MIHGFMSAILTPFAGRDPLAGLVVLGVAFGVLVLAVFRLVSNPEKIRAARKEVMARLYELRLYPDDPAIIFRAQIGLVTGNARYLGRVLMPAALLAIPTALVFAPLDSFFGRAPLSAGEQALVTVQVGSAMLVNAIDLKTPDGIVIETPAVRIPASRQVSWRIRALKPVSGLMRIAAPGGVVDKTVQAGAGPQLISERRVSASRELIEYPEEPRIANASVDWIEVQYPQTEVHNFPWWAWLLAVSIVTTLALRKPFGVAF